MLRHQPKRRGLSLAEVLVVAAIMSSISAFTMVIYTTAFGDYESSTMTKSMVRYARNVSNKMTQIIATAVPRSELERAFFSPVKNATYEADMCDFLSTGNYIKAATSETSYAFDDGTTVPGYQPLFRYQIRWSGTAGVDGQRPNTIFLERREMPTNTSGIPLDVPSNFMSGTYRQPLGGNIGYLGFRLQFGNTLQTRIVVYAVDPVSGRGLDGQLMRTLTKRRRQNATGGDKVYELLTSIPVPTVQIR